MFEAYNKKLQLLIQILPFVAQEKCFALHGGTAINLFVRNMPRLSVDIDLTYLPLEDRSATSAGINDALGRIKDQIEKRIADTRIVHKADAGKLIISQHRTEIKLEVNLVARGVLSEPVKMTVCKTIQDDYGAFVAMPVVPLGQLYGGKICAALDRQHPRDLFDVKLLLENEGFTDAIREGFLLCLLCSNRPIHEILAPNFQDQRQAMENQFAGMSDIPFSYEDYERIRQRLVKTVTGNLTDSDRAFLLGVKNCEPDWRIYDFERFPAVQWKLHNLRQLKEKNPQKHRDLYEALEAKLNA
ncbi:MAG: nucleotidyl transferase AbiEii/AbiGii toxin family protein [Wenzhouxiangellaceae bacterium]